MGEIRWGELERRISWFCILRTVAAVGLVILGALRSLLLPDLAVDGAYLIGLGGGLLLLNGLHVLHLKLSLRERAEEYQRYRSISINLNFQIISDLVVVTLLAQLTGGLESPALYCFTFYVVLACLFYKKRVSLAYTLAIVIAIAGLAFLPLIGVLETTGFWISGPSVWRESTRAVTIYFITVSVAYFFCWYIMATITRGLRRMERQLKAQITEFVKLDSEKTRYVLTATHELKAPFTAIQSYVNVLLGGFVGPVEEPVKGILVKIKERCQRLLVMINELLQLANIKKTVERGATLEAVAVTPILDEIFENLDPLLRQKGVTINRTGMGTGPFRVMGDKEQLQILFSNVMRNAVHYSVDNTRIEVSYVEKDDECLVTVADQGIGIKKELLPKVFLEHFRSEEAVALNRNGTGLGLAISWHIMCNHKGRIWIESDHGIGTKVFMQFDKAVSEGSNGTGGLS